MAVRMSFTVRGPSGPCWKRNGPWASPIPTRPASVESLTMTSLTLVIRWVDVRTAWGRGADRKYVSSEVTFIARLLAGPAGRLVAVVHGLLEELFGLVRPELRDGREGVDDGVLQVAALALDLAYVDVLDGVAPGVELDGPARGVRDLHLAERRHELLPVLHVAPDQARRLVDPAAGCIAGLREVRGDLAVAPAVFRHEAPVDGGIEGGAVHEGCDD